jgi:serine-type D-Ala-D-Ala carboxypeptidase/endopeptidase (penicillin-binding protein 4)
MEKTKIVCSLRFAVYSWAALYHTGKLNAKLLLNVLLIFFSIGAYAQQKQIGKLANTILLKDSAISTGHIGISIYEPAADKYWYNYNASHYFIPASNTKLFSLYAGMRYLGDSLVGLRYLQLHDTIIFQPTADPSFLHPDFIAQPVFNFFKKTKIIVNENRYDSWQASPLGFGWAWDDYNEDYMTERSEFPIYGNLLKIKSKKISLLPGEFHITQSAEISPSFFNKDTFFADGVNTTDLFLTHPESINSNQDIYFRAKRNLGENKFTLTATKLKPIVQSIPFTTKSKYFIYNLLSDTLGIHIYNSYSELTKCFDCKPPVALRNSQYKTLRSQPSDSLFKPMMHNSDNFFAEQTLLMASNEHLGYMSDEKIIDTILKLDLKDIPKKPKWVDGSGLSRYNLFTPQSFVYLLNKMKNEFGLERLKIILPTGGEGTLSSYYKKDAGFIFAKTGTLSNNCALSGYLITSKGKLLIFSVLANNYITNAAPVRKAVEQFLQTIREKY